MSILGCGRWGFSVVYTSTVKNGRTLLQYIYVLNTRVTRVGKRHLRRRWQRTQKHRKKPIYYGKVSRCSGNQKRWPRRGVREQRAFTWGDGDDDAFRRHISDSLTSYNFPLFRSFSTSFYLDLLSYTPVFITLSQITAKRKVPLEYSTNLVIFSILVLAIIIYFLISICEIKIYFRRFCYRGLLNKIRSIHIRVLI